MYECTRWNVFDDVNKRIHSRSRSQTWEKVNIVDNENGTLSFNQKRVYVFSDELSSGSEDDVVIVPNIPMLSATSQSKHAARFVTIYSVLSETITKITNHGRI